MGWRGGDGGGWLVGWLAGWLVVRYVFMGRGGLEIEDRWGCFGFWYGEVGEVVWG